MINAHRLRLDAVDDLKEGIFMAQPEQLDSQVSNISLQPGYMQAGSHAPQLMRMQHAILSPETATIGKGLIIRGEITGDDSLVIEGRAEGNIRLSGNRVTVGPEGVVAANITAREVVILGKVRGNVIATDRVDIRGEGSVIGDLTAPRISIEDGAFFKGGIDIRKPVIRDAGSAIKAMPKTV
jgi:cytoskeletal protein CcmA (bactofilin family)